MLKLADRENLNAHKYKNLKKLSFFHTQVRLNPIFAPHINLEIPNIVGILTVMSRKNLCSAEVSMNFV